MPVGTSGQHRADRHPRSRRTKDSGRAATCRWLQPGNHEGWCGGRRWYLRDDAITRRSQHRMTGVACHPDSILPSFPSFIPFGLHVPSTGLIPPLPFVWLHLLTIVQSICSILSYPRQRPGGIARGRSVSPGAAPLPCSDSPRRRGAAAGSRRRPLTNQITGRAARTIAGWCGGGRGRPF